MNDEAVCRTAPATPGLLKIEGSKVYYAHNFNLKYNWVLAYGIISGYVGEVRERKLCYYCQVPVELSLGQKILIVTNAIL